VIDDQNRAAMRPVVVSHEDQDVAVVDKGLSDGDRVVTVGQYVLQPGARVSIDATANTGS
jgi:multidrug efflux pump subunit AcrA (membrane-fusion protein)